MRSRLPGMYLAMSASYVLVFISLLIFLNFWLALSKSDAALSTASDLPMLSRDETVFFAFLFFVQIFTNFLYYFFFLQFILFFLFCYYFVDLQLYFLICFFLVLLFAICFFPIFFFYCFFISVLF